MTDGGAHPEYNSKDVKMAEKPQEQTIRERVLGLLRKGYSRSQLIADFDFAERTVDAAIRECKDLDGNDPERPSGNAVANAQGLAGHKQRLRERGWKPAEEREEGEERRVTLPAKIDDRKQQIVPEYLMKHFVRLDDGRPLGPLETLILFQAARRSVMEDVGILAGLVETQAKATDAQLKVLREAKSESAEVASRAAEETAARVAQYFDQKRPDIAQSPNPMQGLFARLMETMFTNLVGSMFPQARGQSSLPPGLEDGGVVEGTL
jgi:hypothetical protein